MLISIILDNYNYAHYLSEAIDSVLIQTYQNFELIIADDGSTDESCEIIRQYAERDSRIKPLFKENGGQASAMNAAFEACSGEIICFLDSDDCFLPHKLETVYKLHMEGYDYLFSDHQSIDKEGNNISDTIKRFRYDGHHLFLVYYMSKYPGNVSSTLSLRNKLAQKIFPLPNPNKWKIQADDCIVFQAAMMSRGRFVDEKLTKYRIHTQNGHYGKTRSSDYTYMLLQNRNELKDTALEKMGISQTFLKNAYNLVNEFKTHRKKDYNLLKLYLKVLFFEMDLGFLKKVETTADLLRTYIAKRAA